MNFMPQPRYNPRTQRDVWYYRIKESFHDLTGRIRSRSMLNVGFIDEPSRSHIVKYYDTKEIGEFPKRLVPLSRRPSLTDLDSAIYFSESEIFEHISHQQTTKY